MIVNFWTFLTIAVILGVLLVMFVLYLEHRKEMKQLEVDALKYQNGQSQSEFERVVTKKL